MQTISEAVSVSLLNNRPIQIVWRNRTYKINKIGLHHTFIKGDILYHAFSIISGTIFMRIELDTKNLIWKLDSLIDYAV